MPLPAPPQVIAAFAAFVRERLAALAPEPAEGATASVAMVIVGAAAPFAPTSYARARLLRQLHAGGLLGDMAPRQAAVLELAAAAVDGAPC